MTSLQTQQYEQALQVLENGDYSRLEKIELLMQMAMGLQQRPKNAKQLFDAIDLYDRALALCLEMDDLLSARLHARKATALHMIPSEDAEYLLSAQRELESALPVIEAAQKSDQAASIEEVAEIEMNLGLVIQTLASFHKAKIADAVFWYQRALRVFTKTSYPTEFSILHNNLATAYLSIPMSDERGKMREALAVQSFEAALEVVTLEENPTEYAMLQNNLGNALQYASSSHAVENNLRALEAYDAALKVRDARVSPVAYANTISNKANCLLNLPDDPEHPEQGNQKRMNEALKLYREAHKIFAQSDESGKAEVIAQILDDLENEMNKEQKTEVS
ncbi:MAG: hypothetical protein DKT66_13805 [Candidatus Melainabacteria bacterium]|nr:MAG: hypothetical protein DKT66_13805 [Candidatus Melainabacteria bacterium]